MRWGRGNWNWNKLYKKFQLKIWKWKLKVFRSITQNLNSHGQVYCCFCIERHWVISAKMRHCEWVPETQRCRHKTETLVWTDQALHMSLVVTVALEDSHHPYPSSMTDLEHKVSPNLKTFKQLAEMDNSP